MVQNCQNHIFHFCAAVCPGVCVADRISCFCEAILDIPSLCKENLRCCVAKKIFGSENTPEELIFPKEDSRCKSGGSNKDKKDDEEEDEEEEEEEIMDTAESNTKLKLAKEREQKEKEKQEKERKEKERRVLEAKRRKEELEKKKQKKKKEEERRPACPQR